MKIWLMNKTRGWSVQHSEMSRNWPQQIQKELKEHLIRRIKLTLTEVHQIKLKNKSGTISAYEYLIELFTLYVYAYISSCIYIKDNLTLVFSSEWARRWSASNKTESDTDWSGTGDVWYIYITYTHLHWGQNTKEGCKALGRTLTWLQFYCIASSILKWSWSDCIFYFMKM